MYNGWTDTDTNSAYRPHVGGDPVGVRGPVPFGLPTA